MSAQEHAWMPAETRAKIEALAQRLAAGRAAASLAGSRSQHAQDLEPDVDHVDPQALVGGDSCQTERDLDRDPDGLDKHIRGQYRELLTTDPAYLQARSWKCLPATLTNATKRMGEEWVRKQVAFVAAEIKPRKIKHPGKYLSHILSKNPY